MFTKPQMVIWLAVSVIGVARAGDDISLETASPVVVKTVPQAGSDDVDAALAELKVTFSKDMADGTWSWSTVTQDTFPQVVGKPHYLPDKRTCVLSVRLRPATTYAIWVNSERFRNFKDRSGRPALPYLLVFKTK